VGAELAGIFVGGASRRMGGRPKGLLRAPGGETIVERWAAMFAELEIPCVLVGGGAAYDATGIARIDDVDVASEGALGPLGGVIALLEHARGGRAIAVACDMPYVSLALVSRLVDAPAAPIVAPRRDGRWEPFFARYASGEVLAVARARARRGQKALQALFDAAPATELALEEHERGELRDWDSPGDLD
jgi:molybdopterin-guanine dinucleotide biosynthesis protein A